MNKITIFSNKVYFIVTVMINILLFEGVSVEMTENKTSLPKTLGIWTRTDSTRLVDSTNIFEYMDGAGELYLSYRFDRLEVYEYSADQQENILVEIYVMKTSNDAFGLLSIDWSGEPVTFSSFSEYQYDNSIAPPYRALYHGGLLFLCTDNLYARVMAYRETPESKKAILAIGQAIAANSKTSNEPALLKILPQTFNLDWTLQNNRIGYLRSHLVLNSLYYLSHQNILNLDLSTEAAIAPYVNNTEPSKKIQLLSIKYSTPKQAEKALKNFLKIYLPEHKVKYKSRIKTERLNFFNIEDGWLGYILKGINLAIIFECPSRDVAEMVIKHISKNTIN